MDYVYIVYDQWHGMRNIYRDKVNATNAVKANFLYSYNCDPDNTPLDYNNEDAWGWEGATWWKKEILADAKREV